MGTKEVEELQKAIKDLCARVGWSQKQLARELHWELDDVQNEDEERQFEERLKKDLFRATTKPGRLQYYLDIMRALPDVEKADLVVPHYNSTKELDPELESALTELSAEITRKLVDREN
ncbi:hypothetical protein [Marinimicrobium agarilyticum]|uniref:hypothetical protein n=1 Tax=Marinimicrobium agarilyticum TaxID=306546 RepID=UPI000482F1E8|nr:hypothetical protein [Marinimicrobium agarilyticum]